MSIGTAKPNLKEQDGIPHHFIDCMSVERDYAAGKFELDAISVLNDLFSNHKIVIAVGGSGLYIDALCNGVDDIPSNESVRDSVISDFHAYGIEYLQKELKKVDSAYFTKVDINNPQRLMRAIEVFRYTGKTFTSFRTQPQKKRPFNLIKIGLEMDRELLYERINKRVDLMVNQGLIAEVKSLIPYRNKVALKTVGYKELFDAFDGLHSEEKAIELIKRNSRRYAKRQLTWFKKDERIVWFKPSEISRITQLINGSM